MSELMRVTRWLPRKFTCRWWVRASYQSSWIMSEFVDHVRVRGSCWSSWITLEFVDHVRVGDSRDRNESWMHVILWLLRAFACCRWVRERIEWCPICEWVIFLIWMNHGNVWHLNCFATCRQWVRDRNQSCPLWKWVMSHIYEWMFVSCVTETKKEMSHGAHKNEFCFFPRHKTE